MKGRCIIVFSNQKGGVGKTTLTRELGIYLAGLSLRVLLVDTDPQGNLSKSLMDERREGLYEALTGGEVVLTQIEPTLSLFFGDFRLAALEKSLIGEMDGYTKLRKLFGDPIFDPFEYILIDSPPSLGILSVNGLAAAHHLVVPLNPTLYSLQGTNDLFNTVSKVKTTLNPELSLLGVIINAYDSVPVISRQLKAEIQEAFGSQVFGTVLSKSIKLEEAIASRTGVIYHPHLDRSRAKNEVIALGDELLSRIEAVRSPGEVRDGLR